jgi:uncharacterized protein YndB with AHSA1/START domain
VPAKPANEPESAREYTETRVFSAPARLVFAAWKEPGHIKHWFGPAGYPVTLAEIDFRVGGRWRFAMTGPDGNQNTPFGGEYLEIVPDQKIVFSNTFEDPASRTMIMTVTFDEKDGKTTMVWRTVFESVAMRDAYMGVGMKEGANSALDQLEELVKGLAGS